MAAGLMLRSIGKHTAGTKRQLGLNKIGAIIPEIGMVAPIFILVAK